MSGFKSLFFAALLIFSTGAYAQTCKPTNMGYDFRQVVLGLEGGLECDYGPEFDFKHSCAYDGTFRPDEGAWEGSSDPSVIYCRSGAGLCGFHKISDKQKTSRMPICK